MHNCSVYGRYPIPEECENSLKHALLHIIEAQLDLTGQEPDNEQALHNVDVARRILSNLNERAEGGGA